MSLEYPPRAFPSVKEERTDSAFPRVPTVTRDERTKTKFSNEKKAISAAVVSARAKEEKPVQECISDENMRILQLKRRLRDLNAREISLEGVKVLHKFVEENDFSYLELGISIAKKYFEPVFKFWGKPANSIKQAIHSCLSVIHGKVNRLGVKSLLTHFDPLRKVYERVTHKKLAEIETSESQKDSDVKVLEFKRECELKKDEKEEKIKVEEEKPSEALEANSVFGNDWKLSRLAVWRQIYYKIRLQNSPHLAALFSLPVDTHQQNIERARAEMRNISLIEERPPLSKDCLGCSQFVYEDEDLAQHSSRQPIAYFHSSRLNNIVDGLKKQIVAFLNGRGGIILVGCRPDKERIFPHKEEVAEHHKEQIEAKLQKYVALITPAVNTNKHIVSRFLPLARSPLASPNPHPDFIQGAYLLRIVVAPSEAQQVFYYTEEITTTKTTVTTHFCRQDGHICRQLEGEQIYDFMKTRYHQVAKPHFGTLMHCPLPALTPHQENCRIPDKGKPQYGNQQYYAKPKEGKFEIKECNPLQAGRQNFKNVSLLVGEAAIRAEVLQEFRNKAKVECYIDTAFESERFPLSTTTFLVWHNCKFEKLATSLRTITPTLRSRNNKKNPLLISTINTLQLNCQLNSVQQNEIYRRAAEVSREKVDFKHIEDKEFIRCESIITAVYLYFYINRKYKLKVMFEKCPQGSGKNREKKVKREEDLDERKRMSEFSEQYEQERDYVAQLNEDFEAPGETFDNQASSLIPSRDSYPVRSTVASRSGAKSSRDLDSYSQAPSEEFEDPSYITQQYSQQQYAQQQYAQQQYAQQNYEQPATVSPVYNSEQYLQPVQTVPEVYVISQQYDMNGNLHQYCSNGLYYIFLQSTGQLAYCGPPPTQ